MHSVVLGKDDMTIEEAIQVIKKADAYSAEAIEELKKKIQDKAIALDKYGEYYSILQNCLDERGACALAIQALEKQVPKKPYDVDEREGDSFYYLGFMCPSCNKAIIGQPYRPNYCKHCGQALDWKVEE